MNDPVRDARDHRGGMNAEQVRTLASLLPEVMAQVGYVGKSGVNREQNYAFRSVEDVDAAVNAAFIKCGVSWTTRVELLRLEPRTYGRNDTKTNHAVVALHATLHGPAGDILELTGVGEAFDTTDKAVNKAITAARKYLLTTTFLIPTAGDDPDQHTPHDASPPVGFDTHDEWSRVVAETKQLARGLPPEAKADYQQWFAGQGFEQPWDRTDCDRMLGKITELSVRDDTPADIVGGAE